jgi:hypothetical protein
MGELAYHILWARINILDGTMDEIWDFREGGLMPSNFGGVDHTHHWAQAQV